MNCKHALLLAASTALLPLSAEVCRITVDADSSRGPVNPLVFGANIEAADDRGIFSRPQNAPINLHAVAQGEGTWDPAANRPHPQIVEKFKAMRIGMIRYPGGCLAHNYNWKQSVGPLAERSEWKFGLDEYIRLCRQVGAEPLITLTDYALPPEELPGHMAELIEYLNAPATPAHPWAEKRAAWGHPAPYHVRYFEFGNESNHGNHNLTPRRQYSAEEYAASFRACAAAMRQIDPQIQLGIVMEPGTGEQYDSSWNRTVLQKAGRDADFIVVHFYAPRVANHTPEEALAAVLAYGDQVEFRLQQYRDQARRLTGKNLPLAMTEFNIGSTGNKPHPWRFTFLAGLMNADLQRIWLEPESGMLCANYWQLINGYWGSFRSNEKGEIIQRRAPLAFFETWGKYLGEELVTATLTHVPRLSASAIPGLAVSRGNRMESPRFLAQTEFKALTGKNFPEGIQLSAAGPRDLKIRLNGFNKRNAYPEFAELPRPAFIPAGEAYRYQISFEARYTPDQPDHIPAGALGLGLVDSRGWEKTASAVSISGIQTAREWKQFSGEFQVLPDTPGSKLLLRAEEVSAPLYGTLEIRNLQFNLETQPIFPAYRGITALASRNGSGTLLYLIVFNKNPKEPVQIQIELENFQASTGSGITLSSQAPETTADTVSRPITLQQTSGGFRCEIPAASMTALKFQK